MTNVSRHGLTQSRPREHTPKISNKVIDPVEEGGMKATLTRVIKTVKTNRRNTVDDVIFSLEKKFFPSCCFASSVIIRWKRSEDLSPRDFGEGLFVVVRKGGIMRLN